MADERIDIQVTDKGADTAAANIRAIGTEADKSAIYVERLKAQLASVNTSATQKLAAAANANTNALQKQMLAQEKVSAASSQSALAAQKLATEQARTAAAVAKAATAAAQAESATLRLAAAQGKLAADSAAATTAMETEAAAQARISAMVESSLAKQAAANAPSAGWANGKNPFQAAANDAAAIGATSAASKGIKDLEAEVENLGTKGPGFFAAFKNGALSAWDGLRDFVSGNGTRFLKDTAAGAEELGVKAASATPHIKGNSTAIRELLVIAREGGRGDFNRMAGSVSILASALGLLNVLLPVAIVGLVGFGAAKYTLNTQTEQNSLKSYAESLGLTEKEMKKLSNTTVDASGKLKEHNQLQITFGDVFHGVIDTIKEGVGELADSWGLTTDQAQSATQSAIAFMKSFFENLVGGVYAFANFLYTEVSNLFTLAQNIGTVAGNAIYIMFAKVANGVIMLFNGVATVANAASNALGKGDVIDKMGYLDSSIGHIGDGLKSFRGQDFFGDIRTGANATNRVLGQMGTNIDKAARARIKAAADAIKDNRTAKKPSTAKTQDDYLNDENKKLDDQLRRMNMLKDAREVQEKLDQIEESFIKRRMPLDAQQLAAFRAKIVAVQEGTRVQGIMDSIYTDSMGTTQKYNDTVKATTELLKQNAISQAEATYAVNEARRAVEAHNDVIGANAPLRAYNEALDKITLSLSRNGITQAQANQQTVIATRAYQQATDPLFQMNEEIDKQTAALGKVGDALEQQNYYEQIRQQMLAKGTVLSQQYVQGVNSEVDALMKKNDALRQQQYVSNQATQLVQPALDQSKFLENYQSIYDQLNTMRQSDLAHEGAYQQAMYGLQAKYNEMRLGAYSDLFGALASVASKGHGVIGAIGKAAAIAQATIDGFVAVQKALSSLPPPFNFVAAAAVAIKTGANVAGILSTNVGSYATGGQFIVDGKGGIDANNINMNVTKGERVTIETAKQQRENDAAAAGNGGSAAPVLNAKVVNVVDPRMALDSIDSAEGEQVIMNIIGRNQRQVKQLLG